MGYFTPCDVLDLQPAFSLGSESYLDLELSLPDPLDDGEWSLESSAERAGLVFLPFDVNVCCVFC